MTETFRYDSWSSLKPYLKEMAIINQLAMIELQQIDPLFLSRITDLQQQAADSGDEAQLMRLDVLTIQRVEELRQQGKMTPVEAIQQQAKTIAALTSEKEVLQALNAYSRKFIMNR